MREEGKGKTHEDAQGGTKKQVRNQTIRHAHYVSETESQNLDNQNWDMLMIMFIPRDVCTKPNSNTQIPNIGQAPDLPNIGHAPVIPK